MGTAILGDRDGFLVVVVPTGQRDLLKEVTDMAEKPVYEQVSDLLNSWNPPSEDRGVSNLVGDAPVVPGNNQGTSGSDLPAVPTDEDGNPLYDDMGKKDLIKHLEARGLPTSGNKDDLVARLEESDAEGSDSGE